MAQDWGGLAALITAGGGVILGVGSLLIGEMRERRKTVVTEPTPAPTTAPDDRVVQSLAQQLSDVAKERDVAVDALEDERQNHRRTKRKLADCRRRAAMTCGGAANDGPEDEVDTG